MKAEMEVHPGVVDPHLHGQYVDFDRSKIKERGNYNRHPSVYVPNLNAWIDVEILPLVEQFNTEHVQTGATCQGTAEPPTGPEGMYAPKSSYVGEFALHAANGWGVREIFNLGLRMHQVLKTVLPYSTQDWGIWFVLESFRGGLCLTFENQYLAAITKAFEGFNPETAE